MVRKRPVPLELTQKESERCYCAASTGDLSDYLEKIFATYRARRAKVELEISDNGEMRVKCKRA